MVRERTLRILDVLHARSLAAALLLDKKVDAEAAKSAIKDYARNAIKAAPTRRVDPNDVISPGDSIVLREVLSGMPRVYQELVPEAQLSPRQLQELYKQSMRVAAARVFALVQPLKSVPLFSHFYRLFPGSEDACLALGVGGRDCIVRATG